MTAKKKKKGLRLRPVTLKQANELVDLLHRHHPPVVGHKFSIGVEIKVSGRLCGAVIVGRPVAKGLDDSWTFEVLRVATDGTSDACSILYAAAARAAEAMGGTSIVTYIRKDEPGTSLRAAGWIPDGEVKARSWDCPSRRRKDTTERVDRVRYRKTLNPGRRRKR